MYWSVIYCPIQPRNGIHSSLHSSPDIIHSSLHQNCHHQIIYAKFNFKVFSHPPYEREIWHYQSTNVDQIQRATEQFSWKKSFRNQNVNEMVSWSKKTIKNILSNYIPHETITCDDKDPPWFNKNIKQLIQEKNNTYKSYILSDKNPQIFEKVKSLQNQLKCSIEGSKKKYYLRISKKLMDSATSAKTYWSILKALLNNKKIPCIPPLFHEGKYVTDFKKKAELFNSFFAKQCSIIQNSSKLPLTLNKKTNNSISSITFNRNDIATIIRSLDPNKAHGYDIISIPMLEICDKSICKPLELIFKPCIKHGKFPKEWKMAKWFLFTRKVINRF